MRKVIPDWPPEKGVKYTVTHYPLKAQALTPAVLHRAV